MDQTTRIFRANAFCSIGKVKKKAAWIIQNGLIYSVKKSFHSDYSCKTKIALTDRFKTSFTVLLANKR